MKIRTAVISVVVSAALVAGAGYGAYHAMQGSRTPVEVVPVSNVNTGYWGGSESFFGSVTSQVAQTVQLNEDYSIAEIFVKEGDEVTEGTPLFSYDMTLQELEYEMEELTLQTQGLTLTKLEKDLEKLKGTRATASLESRRPVMTASSGEEEVLEETSGDASAAEQNAVPDSPVGIESQVIPEDEEQGILDSVEQEVPGAQGTQTETPGSLPGGTTGGQGNSGGLKIEGMEVVGSSGENAEDLTLIDSVISYERLVLAIDVLFRSYGDELRAEEIGSAVEEAVAYYRKHLADEKITQEQDAEDRTIEIRTYVLKEQIGKVLGEEDYEKLVTINKKMDEYQTRYVDMLIFETSRIDPADTAGFLESMNQIQKSYDFLTTAQQRAVQNVAVWQELKERAQNLPKDSTQTEENAGQEVQTEDGTVSETEQTDAEQNNTEQTDTEQTSTEQGTENQDGTGNVENPDGTNNTGDGQGETGDITGNESEVLTEVPGEVSDIPEKEALGETETLVTEALEGNTYGAEVPEEKESYTLTIYDPAKGPEPEVLEYEEGSLVVSLKAKEDDPTRTFVRWEITDPGLNELQGWEQPDWTIPGPTFNMPSVNLTVTAVYIDNIDQIDVKINTFLAMADYVLQEGAAEALEAQGKDYATELGTAVAFYQQWLCYNPVDIVDTPYDEADMSKFQMLENVEQYLNEKYPEENKAQQMKDSYKELSIRYARALFDKLDPNDLVRVDLDEATRVYRVLGEEWQFELEARWQEEQMQKTEQDGSLYETEPTDPGIGDDGEDDEEESEDPDQNLGGMTPATPASIGDLLAVYNVYILFQDYQKMDPDASEDSKFTALQAVARQYNTLTEEQKLLVMQQNPELVATLQQYGLWEEPAIPEPDPGDDWGGFDDFGDEGYTASELREMIEEKEYEIKTCKLDIRETELNLKSRKRVLDGKVVRSTLDGTVVGIGTADGESDDDYFVKVTNQTGLYAKGSMNELALEKIHVGDTISGMMTNTGISFTAEIKEISSYPDPNGGNMSFGTENTNASYYPFFAKIDDVEGIEEGEAEIQLSGTLTTNSDGIYLEKYFVRTESDGRSYVYMQGPDGKLKKQYIQTGKTIYSYAIEIVSGLELTDRIAFPYGKNVVEGADTKEVDALQDAYM